MDCDLLVIGGGLAGLVAATEATARGLKVIILDQEGEQNLGGQASGRSAASSSSIVPNSDGCASATISISQGRTGWAPPSSTGPKTTGRANGPKPISNSPPAKNAPGCIRSACAGSRSSAGRTRRVAGQRPWQFRPPLPHHLGHRPGVLAPFVRLAREAEKKGLLSLLPLPPSG